MHLIMRKPDKIFMKCMKRVLLHCRTRFIRLFSPAIMLVADDDEFDGDMSPPASPVGQCRAIYDYAAQQYDELSIKSGE